MHSNLAVRPFSEYARHTHRGSSRSAGQGNTASAFPRPHCHLAGRMNVHKVNVGPIGECWVPLKHGALHSKVYAGDVVGKNDRMRVTHGDEHRFVLDPQYRERVRHFVANEQVFSIDWN